MSKLLTMREAIADLVPDGASVALGLYHEQTKTTADTEAWLQQWVYGVSDRRAYIQHFGRDQVEALQVKQHAYAAPADFGY